VGDNCASSRFSPERFYEMHDEQARYTAQRPGKSRVESLVKPYMWHVGAVDVWLGKDCSQTLRNARLRRQRSLNVHDGRALVDDTKAHVFQNKCR